jgi:glycosyltransferase involved in cell wall biosynthesis
MIRYGDPMTAAELKVCVVGQHASLNFGGEASFPWFYFKFLRARGIDTTMVVHARTRDELKAAFAADFDRIYFVDDTFADRFLYKIGKLFPGDLDSLTLAVLRHWLAQRRQRRVIRNLIQAGKVNIIHESSPIAPKQISDLHGLGAPLVIGPLSGGMEFPPAFRYRQGRSRVWAERFSRSMSGISNFLVPGKKRAEALLVANDLTKDALPRGYRGKVYMMPEVSVDLTLWKDEQKPPRTDDKIRIIYLGRLVNWKAVDLLMEAFARVVKEIPNANLEILGDGEDRSKLEQQVRDLGIADKVEFAGYVKGGEGVRRMRSADIFVLPSLRECGGVVMLEAMAVGLPVIGANWAGPATHITDQTGIRVGTDSQEGYIQGLTDAMLKLAKSPELRAQLGEAGKQRVLVGDYDWQQKIDHLVQIFIETIEASHPLAPGSELRKN